MTPTGPIRSCRASRTVDLVAPGVNLLLATYDGNPADTEAGVIASGTSFAAPIVASGVSLLDSLSYHLSYTVEFSIPRRISPTLATRGSSRRS